MSFSQVPLSIASWLGMICTGVAFLAIIFIIIRKIIMGDPVQGWASTICLIMFIGGIQLFCMGIMGQYIGKTYVEAKGRPHYTASEGSDEDIIKVG